MSNTRLISLLHFADSALPTGGYAHSFGLEALCQAGAVADAAGVEQFLASQLEGSAGPCDATAAAAARRAFARGDLAACCSLDDTLEAMKSVREFREGSRQMGRQTLRVAAVLTGAPRLQEYLAAVGAGRAPGHHAVAFGMAAGALGWEPEETTAAFLYSATALLVGAALRLLPMGQLEGQRLLWRLHPVIERLAREAAARDPSGMWSFAPGIELAGIRHEGLEMRLFRS
ncbi:MAG: urease accessory protein UreF [Candidatus Rokubacteria bacterium]|nr:urease accessory protein UreF [Candidatus Rokubacteria bacterium]